VGGKIVGIVVRKFVASRIKRCEESVGTAMESFVTGRQAW